jgi:decaprenylphospho-beta-D-erythro-pentofuranosid-2-ulose 2-reductase
MRNALREPQTVVLVGGTSEIGLAMLRRLVGPATTSVVLLSRDLEQLQRAAESLGPITAMSHVLHLDLLDLESHATMIAEVVALVGDLDMVIVAAGVLGDEATRERDLTEARRVMETNYVGAGSMCLAVAHRLRNQGHGHLVVLSSVAAERPRRANYVYGSSKAGLDALAQGLADDLHGTGVDVTIVRPGFVRTKMTAGMTPAPFATTADAVAATAVDGLHRGRRIVWAPPVLRYVFMALRHLPAVAYRRLTQD